MHVVSVLDSCWDDAPCCCNTGSSESPVQNPGALVTQKVLKRREPDSANAHMDPSHAHIHIIHLLAFSSLGLYQSIKSIAPLLTIKNIIISIIRTIVANESIHCEGEMNHIIQDTWNEPCCTKIAVISAFPFAKRRGDRFTTSVYIHHQCHVPVKAIQD